MNIMLRHSLGRPKDILSDEAAPHNRAGGQILYLPNAILIFHIPLMIEFDHDYFMEIALKEAQQAFDESEVPVGAVVVREGSILGRGHNRTEALKDATAHAEILAITSAAASLGDWRLDNAILYTTIEPCAMCAGAAVLSRIETIVYGAPDPRFGACGSLFEIPTDKRLIHRVKIIRGVKEQEAADLMQLFFRQVRKNKEKVN